MALLDISIPKISVLGSLGPLNIVFTGNSILNGLGASTGHTPAEQLASLRPTDVVTNVCVNGQDTPYYTANFGVQVQPHFNAARTNVVVLLETIDYVDDTLGSAGSGLALTDPTAAGLDAYNKAILFASTARSNSWVPIIVCGPDIQEPSTYADAAANLKYQTARDHCYDLVIADTNTTHFYTYVNARARSEFSSPYSLTYYQNAPDGERIHLTDAGYDLLALLIHQTLGS